MTPNTFSRSAFKKIEVEQILQKIKLIECVDVGIYGDEYTVKEEDIEATGRRY